MTKAEQIMRVAYATFRKNEPDLAKEIFAMAMQHPSAVAAYGEPEELRAQLDAAVRAGDYAAAADYLGALKAQAEDQFTDEADLPDPELAPADADECVGEECGDVDVDMEGLDVEEGESSVLSAVEAGTLAILARQIKAAGHQDLAGRITQALGL